ncbi:uncharacterized protein LOC121802086 isoform X1 [Salvia splendens]|uniref:uncharacterized protein LOC121802086 isoform X1 n=1 Tax=Salvia splendens TaxID=180675 RepID=UPI001C253D42|nr:uncharacterized protein LOC121802086 isoform X1 [Salvia splendens]
MDCFSSPPPRPPPPLLAAASPLCSPGHVLNMSSSRPSHHMNRTSSDLVKEITTLDVEIVRLEQYLLSLYRTSFQKTIPSNPGYQQMTGVQPCVTSDQSSQRTKSEMSKDCYEHQGYLSPTSALTGPNDMVPFTTPKTSSERERKSVYRTSLQKTIPSNPGDQQMTGIQPRVSSDQSSQRTKDYYEHQGYLSPTSALTGPNDMVPFTTPKSSSERERKSVVYFRRRCLADHLGNFCVDDACIFPDKLSEGILRCISAIYCKLGSSTRSHKGYSVSSNSSFWSSSTFSPRNLSGNWSPQCNDEVSESYTIEGLKQDNGPYAAMVEVLNICLDGESYSHAAIMLQKFRSLVKSLENLDPRKMRREQKLAFWINIHNALTMHAHLAYETQTYTKSTAITKAVYNVGGHCINAYDIQSSILGIKSHYSAPWLQTLLSPGRKFRAGISRHVYAIDYPEPLVHFALSSGARSDPAIRIYNAKSIFEDLNIAKEEFIQATAYVHKQKRLYLPKILHYYAKDMSLGMSALLKVVGDCLPEYQQKVVDRFAKSRPEKCVCWLEESSSFRYLIHKEVTEMAWG